MLSEAKESLDRPRALRASAQIECHVMVHVCSGDFHSRKLMSERYLIEPTFSQVRLSLVMSLRVDDAFTSYRFPPGYQ
jgi:hypothetical protein